MNRCIKRTVPAAGLLVLRRLFTQSRHLFFGRYFMQKAHHNVLVIVPETAAKQIETAGMLSLFWAFNSFE